MPSAHEKTGEQLHRIDDKNNKPNGQLGYI
jgi:hypothetical protein